MKKQLIFHIEEDDYFGTLATILTLIKEGQNNKKILVSVIGDLVYLQGKYKIIKKSNNTNV